MTSSTIVKTKRLVPPKNSPESDIVMTPKDVASEILFHFKPSGRVLDPCKGDGAFTVGEWCEIREGRNFYDWKESVDWVITNPPWSDIKNFLIHSMKISENIVFLAPINHFITKARLRIISENGFGLKEFHLVDTPKEWPQSGFQIAAVLLVKGYKGPTHWT